MANRIEVASKIPDMRAEVRGKKLVSMGFPVTDVKLVDVYTVDSEDVDLNGLASMLVNPVSQEARIDAPKAPEKFDCAVEIGFLPGVTDNVGNTAREMAEDMSRTRFEGQGVYTSQVMFLSGVSKEDAAKIADSSANPVIKRTSVKSREEFLRDGGMGTVVPKVKLHEPQTADLVDILDADDIELQRIGKAGVFDHNRELTAQEYANEVLASAKNVSKRGDLFEEGGKFYQKVRRGPLAMDLSYMKAVRKYFEGRGRNPTDIELESIAQTWSEHCKHTIFADPIDELQEGLFKTFIKAATNRIRQEKGDRDFCVSVFEDNAGGIEFDEEFLICDKAETHNSPSALDPFGGSITGIVGVNRDPMGFGLGAKPIINGYGFCFGNPNDTRVLFKGPNKTQRMLSPRIILNDVVDGVNVGGNCSGIPTDQGFVYFDDGYRGKPLVFVRTSGIIPKKHNGRELYKKCAMAGDYIVMVGGKVGRDGIHGATFSSEAIDSGSPATAVQIGDPITQKKMSDALVKEARDFGLYNSITDNGAGGLSCSVAEMAKESGGCKVDLHKVPLKYPWLKPWEIWISESQERMTLSVPPEKWAAFSDLMKRRGVEATVIGEFTNTGNCVVEYKDKVIMDVGMDFLHDGLPPRPIKTTFTRQVHEEPDFECPKDLTQTVYSMLARRNIASFEFISQQYDHEVQGGSVIKPLQGRGRVNGDATIVRPVLSSKKAVVLSHGINPSYSDIDTYNMAACAIDTAVRNSVAAGADLEHLALLDNFCWCSSTEPERLGQLKRACQACYDTAVKFGTPFISGKDSMFNDFKGYDENGNPIKISIPPTLLISSLGVMQDSRKAVSIDAKFDGDLVYVLGETHEELGGSEYFAMKGEETRGKGFVGNNVPKVDVKTNKALYQAVSKAVQEELLVSAISVHRGGLATALAKSAMAGLNGMEIDLTRVPSSVERDDSKLYSESMGRLVVTVNPKYRERFEELMKGNAYAQIGLVRANNRFVVNGGEGKQIINADLEKMVLSYKSTFKDY